MKISSHKRVLGTIAAGLALSAAIAAPAQAATTTATFTLAAAGGLSVSAPTSATASSSGTAGSNTVSISLGNVQVVDNQGALAATWTATVSATDFVTTEGGTGAGTLAARTITKDRAAYTFGTVTQGGGLVTATKVETPVAIFGTTNPSLVGVGVGNNSATWNPTVAISVPSTAVVGTYTGTITHSVA